MKEVLHIHEVLNGEGFIQSPTMFESSPNSWVLRLTFANEGVDWIAGNGVSNRKRADADNEEHNNRLYETACDVIPKSHKRLLLTRIARARKGAPRGTDESGWRPEFPAATQIVP